MTRDLRRCAPDASNGISRPGCSASVVITSSSGVRRNPVTTMLQPSVVEVVRMTLSAGTWMSAATRCVAAVAVAEAFSHTLAVPRPRVRAAASSACIVSNVRRESGPTEPAFM